MHFGGPTPGIWEVSFFFFFINFEIFFTEKRTNKKKQEERTKCFTAYISIKKRVLIILSIFIAPTTKVSPQLKIHKSKT